MAEAVRPQLITGGKAGLTLTTPHDLSLREISRGPVEVDRNTSMDGDHEVASAKGGAGQTVELQSVQVTLVL